MLNDYGMNRGCKKIENFKEFNYSWQQNDAKVEFTASLPIPLLNHTVNDFGGMLIAANRVPCFLKDDLIQKLADFVYTETNSFYDCIAQQTVDNFRSIPEAEVDAYIDDVAKRWQDLYQLHFKRYAPSSDCDNNFAQQIFQNKLSKSPVLMQQWLIKERFQVDDLHALLHKRKIEIDLLTSSYDDRIINCPDAIEKQVLVQQCDAEMKEIYSSFDTRLKSIRESQRQEFHKWLSGISESSTLLQDSISAPMSKVDISYPVKSLSADIAASTLQKVDKAERLMKSLTAAVDNRMTRMEDSFTIHLGAQMKTMHNLRLVCMRGLELCEPDLKLSQEQRDIERLQILMDLYGENLKAVVVFERYRYPLIHIDERSEFSRICEKSGTELHFDDFRKQCDQVVASSADIVRDNKLSAATLNFNGSLISDSLSVSSSSSSAFQTARRAPTMPDQLSPLDLFHVGDVWISRHSTLSKVHVVFHLVVGDEAQALAISEINSRHPVIAGLRNVMRLVGRFSITTVSIPLLLVDELSDEATIQWCLKRAELVMKCVKGFMMEAQGGNSITVQFLCPPLVSQEVFTQLSELLSEIFQLSSPLMAK